MRIIKWSAFEQLERGDGFHQQTIIHGNRLALQRVGRIFSARRFSHDAMVPQARVYFRCHWRSNDQQPASRDHHSDFNTVVSVFSQKI
jgi:hypothetical protein